MGTTTCVQLSFWTEMWCGTRICLWAGVAFLPTPKPPCPGQPWPRLQGQSPAQPASCLCLEMAGALSSWGLRWPLPALEVSHTEPSPLPLTPLPRPAASGKQTGSISGPQSAGSGNQLCSAAFFPRSWCQADSASASGETPDILC